MSGDLPREFFLGNSAWERSANNLDPFRSEAPGSSTPSQCPIDPVGTQVQRMTGPSIFGIPPTWRMSSPRTPVGPTEQRNSRRRPLADMMEGVRYDDLENRNDNLQKSVRQLQISLNSKESRIAELEKQLEAEKNSTAENEKIIGELRQEQKSHQELYALANSERLHRATEKARSHEAHKAEVAALTEKYSTEFTARVEAERFAKEANEQRQCVQGDAKQAQRVLEVEKAFRSKAEEALDLEKKKLQTMTNLLNFQVDENRNRAEKVLKAEKERLQNVEKAFEQRLCRLQEAFDRRESTIRIRVQALETELEAEKAARKKAEEFAKETEKRYLAEQSLIKSIRVTTELETNTRLEAEKNLREITQYHEEHLESTIRQFQESAEKEQERVLAEMRSRIQALNERVLQEAKLRSDAEKVKEETSKNEAWMKCQHRMAMTMIQDCQKSLKAEKELHASQVAEMKADLDKKDKDSSETILHISAAMRRAQEKQQKNETALMSKICNLEKALNDEKMALVMTSTELHKSEAIRRDLHGTCVHWKTYSDDRNQKIQTLIQEKEESMSKYETLQAKHNVEVAELNKEADSLHDRFRKMFLKERETRRALDDEKAKSSELQSLLSASEQQIEHLESRVAANKFNSRLELKLEQTSAKLSKALEQLNGYEFADQSEDGISRNESLREPVKDREVGSGSQRNHNGGLLGLFNRMAMAGQKEPVKALNVPDQVPQQSHNAALLGLFDKMTMAGPVQTQGDEAAESSDDSDASDEFDDDESDSDDSDGSDNDDIEEENSAEEFTVIEEPVAPSLNHDGEEAELIRRLAEALSQGAREYNVFDPAAVFPELAEEQVEAVGDHGEIEGEDEAGSLVDSTEGFESEDDTGYEQESEESFDDSEESPDDSEWEDL
ncbi:hypothetical protein HII31_12870 [Pseudocercospora fuligena]|uniref:Uncharacterized protein n=1 Tax=Pseudocercospora fuligena TaxID=685502 RepID=A0A8H6R749_9PEZI|nr:hypothetical protein HII31_12870 [Pseudocercospora fuligena]